MLTKSERERLNKILALLARQNSENLEAALGSFAGNDIKMDESKVKLDLRSIKETLDIFTESISDLSPG